MDKTVILILVLVNGLYFVSGTGRLKLPPGRSTLWRYFGGYNYDLHVNYDDGNLNCGSVRTNGDLTSSCGVCGDPFNAARKENSFINPSNTQDRGLYVTGIPGYLFQQGREVDFTVEIESGSRGWFKFQICNLPNADTEVTEGCFRDLTVSTSNPGTVLSGNRYQLPDQSAGSSGMGHNVTVQLPASLTCDHCVVRWIWLIVNCETTNCENVDERSLAAVTVVNCADVQILSSTKYTQEFATFNFPKFDDPYASVHGEQHGGGGGLTGGGSTPLPPSTETTTPNTGGSQSPSTTIPTRSTTLKTGGLNSPPVITNLPKPTTTTIATTTQPTLTIATTAQPTPPSTTMKTGGLNSPPVITFPPDPTTLKPAPTLKQSTLDTGGLGGDTTTTPHNWHTTTPHNWHTTPHINWDKAAKKSSNWFGSSNRSNFIKLILFLSLLGFGRNSNQPTSITWMPYYWQRNYQLPGYGYTMPGKQQYTGYGNGYMSTGNNMGYAYGYQKPYTGYGQINGGKTYRGYGTRNKQGQTGYSNSVWRRATNSYRQPNHNYQISRNVPQIPNPSLSAHDVHKEFDVEPEVMKNEATALHNVEKIDGGDPGSQCGNGMVLQCGTKKGVTPSGITEWICKACTQWNDDQPCPSDICDCQCVKSSENAAYNTMNGKK